MSKLAMVMTIAACAGKPPKAAPKPPPPDAAVAIEEPAAPPAPSLIIKRPDQLEWKPLGDTGTMVAGLWGEMDSEPSGFFIKLPMGDAGALHTHRYDYQAISISGTVTNRQDGAKRSAPLPPQSYWFQPGGVAHTTSCGKPADCIAYAHFLGRFDIAAATPARGAKPDPRYVEKRVKDLSWRPVDAKQPKGTRFAPLWGDPRAEPSGMLVKIPAGSAPPPSVYKSDYHGVVLAGTVQIEEGSGSGSGLVELPVGSYWMQPATMNHATSCKAGGPDCIVYVHLTGPRD